MAKKRKGFKSVGAYFVELFILIFGITISFFLNEWRENISHRDTERQILRTISENLSADTLQFKQHILSINYMTDMLEPLLEHNNKAVLSDSLSYYLDAFISYSTFFRADIGYQEMKATGNSRWIRDRDLLKKIITYYTQNNAYLNEWNGIDKGFILYQTIPYFEKNFPYSHYAGYKDLYKNNNADLKKALQQNEFKNLVRDNILFKSASKQAFEINKKSATELLKAIDEYLN